MSDTENKLTEQESLKLIHSMISKAKGSYHDTGIGPILWGSLITICSLITFSEIQFGFELPFDEWLLIFVAIIPQIFISIKETKMRKAVKYEDAAVDYTWLTFGIAIFLMMHINANLYGQLNPVITEYKKLKGTDNITFSYSSFSTAIFLMLYGIPSFITGGICKFKPMLYGGIVCWVCCVISVYTNIKTDLLLMALSAICAWLIPGIILRRRFVAKKNDMNV